MEKNIKELSLEICIPTLGRINKLKNCIDSIVENKDGFDIDLNLWFSNVDELEIISKFCSHERWINCFFVKEYRVPVFWNDKFNRMGSDILMYLNDDTEFFSDTIKNIFEGVNKYFPNLDGILGINQDNIPDDQALKTAFGVVGKNYIKRFLDGQVYCPEYFRFFGDREMLLFAESINKFYYDENIKIKHWHANFGGELDETHRAVRKFLNKDKFIFEERQKLGYLWGRDFNLLEKNGDKA